MTARAVTEDTLGAWLVKASPGPLRIEELVRDGIRGDHLALCPADLPGRPRPPPDQPVLLWVSGNDRRHPAGIYACGHTTGPVDLEAPSPEMPVRLRAVEPVIHREEILADPTLAGIEVVRMPAGSNPSYLDTEQYHALQRGLPPGTRRATPRLEPVKTFEELWAELSEKAETRPEGSGTVRALDAGVHEIGKKLVEEAAESWMAAEHESHERAAEEISQLLYHAQVLMLAAGVSLDDVYSHL